MNPRFRPLVDWEDTKAYGLGLNGLYLNLAGRERDGIVEPKDREQLLEDIRAQLLAIRDPLDGKPVIAEVHRADEVYSGPNVEKAPDLIVGYHSGYRASWDTTLGDISEEVLSDNDSAWSADHCMSAGELPGVLFSNRAILRDRPSLIDLAPTILETFDVEPPATLAGGTVFGARASAGV
jgi:predicted AlkP superfamily phosphohydrolase/phosphomutase